jgi:4'-phosphopantetheinyl transferase
MTLSDWRASPQPVPFPGRDEVHLWRVKLSEENEEHWRGMLTADEHERANRFQYAADRRRFIVTRAILRILLGQYVNVPPESLCFQCNEFGKPTLDRSQNPRGINFNVAHSGDYSLLAFGQAAHIGVDVEHLEIERDVENLAKAVFSPSQCASILGLPDELRKKAFFEAWTRKEAILKALGGGLSIALDSPEVENAGAPEWFIRNIEVDGQYAAAIAVKARNIGLSLWTWATAPGTSWSRA